MQQFGAGPTPEATMVVPVKGAVVSYKYGHDCWLAATGILKGQLPGAADVARLARILEAAAKRTAASGYHQRY